MFLALLVVFVVMPIIELYVIIAVGSAIGALPTLALLLSVSLLGAWLVTRQGLGIWRRAQQQLQRGELPADEMLDGLLVLLAGVLFLAPGFVSDLVGLLLLVPVTRSLARGVMARRFRRRFVAAGVGYAGPGGTYLRTEVYDVGDVTPPQWRPHESPRGAPPELEAG